MCAQAALTHWGAQWCFPAQGCSYKSHSSLTRLINKDQSPMLRVPFNVCEMLESIKCQQNWVQWRRIPFYTLSWMSGLNPGSHAGAARRDRMKRWAQLSEHSTQWLPKPQPEKSWHRWTSDMCTPFSVQARSPKQYLGLLQHSGSVLRMSAL